MVEVYTPGRGDLVWMDFDPQIGHEQKGRRPALIVSPKSYNAKTGLCLLYPITTKIKGYPFEVALPDFGSAQSVALSDQLKSFDWTQRKIEFMQCISDFDLKRVLNRSNRLLQIV